MDAPLPSLSHRRQSLLRRQRGSRFIPHRHARSVSSSSTAISRLLLRSSARVSRLSAFSFTDIKILLISHAHYDHCAGSAEILRLTQRKVLSSWRPMCPLSNPAAKPIFNTASDLVHALSHRRTLTAFSMTATRSASAAQFSPHISLPGTPKAQPPGPWTRRKWAAAACCHCRQPKCESRLQVVQQQNVPADRLRLQARFAVLKALPCDIFLGAHGGYFGLGEICPLETRRS